MQWSHGTTQLQASSIAVHIDNDKSCNLVQYLRKKGFGPSVTSPIIRDQDITWFWLLSVEFSHLLLSCFWKIFNVPMQIPSNLSKHGTLEAHVCRAEISVAEQVRSYILCTDQNRIHKSLRLSHNSSSSECQYPEKFIH